MNKDKKYIIYKQLFNIADECKYDTYINNKKLIAVFDTISDKISWYKCIHNTDKNIFKEKLCEIISIEYPKCSEQLAYLATKNILLKHWRQIMTTISDKLKYTYVLYRYAYWGENSNYGLFIRSVFTDTNGGMCEMETYGIKREYCIRILLHQNKLSCSKINISFYCDIEYTNKIKLNENTIIKND